MDVAKEIEAALLEHPAVTEVRLVGSRANGTAAPFSDWDFKIEATDADALAGSLPRLLAQLRPIAQFWDPLTNGTPSNYIVTLPGPTAVDLFFDRDHTREGPWAAAPTTLQSIDDHFWDWTRWLAGKYLKGETALVGAELNKMFGHLLSPMGVDEVPRTLDEAVSSYRTARGQREMEYGVDVSRKFEEELVALLRRHGFTG